MQEDDRHRIAINRNTLCHQIEFQNLIPFLIQKQILTEARVGEIESNFLSNSDQVRALLDDLRRLDTDRNAFDQFVECLIETGHTDAAGLIRPGVDITVFGSNSSPPPSLTDQPRLLVKKADRKKIKTGQKYYKMSSRPRGFWVIINNYEFKNKRYEDRKGSEKDAKRMAEVAADLGFEVKSETNLGADDMLEFLHNISSSDELRQHDALFVLIMTHGDGDELAGSDGILLHTHEIKGKFDSNHCEALIGKPKVFIFVSCRGAFADGPRKRSHSLTDQPSSFESSFEKCTLTASGDACDQQRVNQRSRHVSGRAVSDMLTAYSTCPGYVSHRHPEDGTYYISALARVLMEHSYDTHFTEILTKVDEEFANKLINDEYMQTPGFEKYGFNKKLYFNPGYFDDEPDEPGVSSA